MPIDDVMKRLDSSVDHAFKRARVTAGGTGNDALDFYKTLTPADFQNIEIMYGKSVLDDYIKTHEAMLVRGSK